MNVRGGDQFAAAFDRLREVELGTPNTAEQLDRWLRDYARTFSEISELTRVWQDALDLAPELVRDAAATIYQACRAVAQFLGGRERGDAHGEAIVFMALLVSAHMPHRASVGRRELSPALTRGFMLAATDRGD